VPACARSEIVREGEVGVYHCWSRCVRRAFLCGHDELTGRDYEHRREWVRTFCERLAGLFGVEVGFHVEMSNHLHLVLRTRPDVVDLWSDEDVVRRYLTITRLVRSRDGRTIRQPTEVEIAMVLAQPAEVTKHRAALSSISKFVGALSEHVARRANREDGVDGRFWEGRFRCRRLETEAAILICGIYVDLNQIRAGEAFAPETSTHTSAYDRIAAMCKTPSKKGGQAGPGTDGWLCELTLDERAGAYDDPGRLSSRTGARASDKGLLPVRLEEYLELLDWSGRAIHEGKRGAIPQTLAPILARLGINTRLWTELVTRFDRLFGHVVGRTEHLAEQAERTGRRWCRGGPICRAAFG
jgi:hypothetical protein